MSDLDIGMNLWLSEPFAYPDQPINRGKRLDKIELEEFYAEKGEWFRFRDYDGDGIPYRTVPGTDHPRAAYFARGTGHNDMAVYSERSDDWVQNLKRLHTKFDTARSLVPAPVIDYNASRSIGIISYGSNDPAVQEARDRMAVDGIETNYMRLRALPINQDVIDFVKQHERVYVVENNFDGQMWQILRMEIPGDTSNLISLPLGDTLPMTARWVHTRIFEAENK